MTIGNEQRVADVIKTLEELTETRKDAQHCALILLQVQERITVILTDLVLRPEVNYG